MRLSILPTLFIVTSVSAVSLSDISPLPSNSVTPGCESTYSEQLSACPSDLPTSKQCSAECADALNETAKKVIVACRQSFVGPDSLLRRVLDGGIQKVLCGAAVSATPSGNGDSVPTATKITTTALPTSTSTSESTLTESSTIAATTGAPSFSGVMTFSTIERPSGSSSLGAFLTLDNAPAPTGSFETVDPSLASLYNPSSTSTTGSRRIAAASSSPSSGSGNGSPFVVSETSSAPSSSANMHMGAWAAFALVAVFLSL
ncbi:hypothetical protein L873DRAFT_155572 [Choiromyces venosus 120613-1]|uniref:Extracellular membrane protein CFEM domain-containing protein n=1 Tax=Choiromyces venosus 120613-1 TaxID=1336337 RepID=A0A3N4JFR0_9PEZI|nr:hypothetical protein L873DRAFT_155572 [Choiromyces venosus 120613-1]